MKKKVTNEDRHDITMFDKAYAEYLKDPKTYSDEELSKLLGLKDNKTDI